MEVDLAVSIRKPPAVVFAFLADVQDHVDEAPRSIVPELEKVTPGPTRVGTRWREVVRAPPGPRFTIWSQATPVEPDRRLAESFAAAWMRGTLEYTVTPTAEGCLLRQRQVVTPRGPFRILQPLLGRLFRARVAARLDGIAEHLEAAAARHADGAAARPRCGPRAGGAA